MSMLKPMLFAFPIQGDRCYWRRQSTLESWESWIFGTKFKGSNVSQIEYFFRSLETS
jgi:hypothetical protein